MATRVSQRVAREMGGGAVKTWGEVIALGKLPGVTDLGQGSFPHYAFLCVLRVGEWRGRRCAPWTIAPIQPSAWGLCNTRRNTP